MHRSGRVRLRMGDFFLEVQPGTSCSSEQELVALGSAAPGERVDLHRLGKLHDRMIVTPDVEHLLAQCAAEAQPPAPAGPRSLAQPQRSPPQEPDAARQALPRPR